MSLIRATFANAPALTPLALFGTDAEAVTRIESSLGTIRWVSSSIKGGFRGGFYARVSPRPDWLRPYVSDRCTAHSHLYCANCADRCAPAYYWEAREQEGRA